MRILGHLISGSALVLSACVTDDEEGLGGEPADCNEYSPIDIAGRWTITGTGTMSRCESLRNNGDLELEIAPLNVYAQAKDDGEAVVTTDNEPDAFVQRIVNAGVVFSSDDMRNFSFDGSGLTCRISFVLVEDSPNEESMTFSFEGYILNPRTIEGRFSGRGPGSCRAIGTFQAAVE